MIFKALALYLLIPSSYANSDYKVIGRGVYDSVTGEKLQMACVGDLIENSNERSCNTLKFLHISTNGSQKLIGPDFIIQSDEKIRHQMIKQFNLHQLSVDRAYQYKFLFTRGAYGKGSKRNGEPAKYLFFIGGNATVYFVATAASAVPFGQGLAIVMASFFASPVIVDFALLPITSILDLFSKEGLYGFDVRSVEALQDKAKFSWQFKPKKMKSIRFKKIVESLNKILSQSDICHLIRNKKTFDTKLYHFLMIDQEKNVPLYLEYVIYPQDNRSGFVSFKSLNNKEIRSIEFNDFYNSLNCKNAVEEVL